MTQPLGRMERPSSEAFRGRRKLLLAPRVYSPPADEAEGNAIVRRYWDQIEAQVASLEAGLGPVRHVYHESVTDGGEDALAMMQSVDARCHALIQARCAAGATFEATEDAATLQDTLDLQGCLMLPFSGSSVPTKLREWLADATRQRYEFIAQRIDETLGEDEVGVLFINERHQVQFPEGVEVFFVAPPALDEYRRWLSGWAARRNAAFSEAAPEEEQSSPVDAAETD